MQLNGSEIVIECLKEQGVDTVFGYPGGTILNVYDALYKHSEIKHYLTSHEQGASHAADGYARATGKVGVCLATSGPGATNLVTGIATANMDSVPLVAITANVGVSLLGKDTFQEVDIAGVVMPITKYSVIVKDIEQLAPTIRRAFKIAQSGRPGPVLVDITKDVTANVTEYTPVKPEPIERVTSTISEEDLKKAAELINASEKPYVFVGGGVNISGASEELMKFVKKIQYRILLEDIPQMTRKDYVVRGCTALLDAIGGAVNHIDNIHKYARKKDVPAHTMFIITTDGQENSSKVYNIDNVRKMIEKHKKKYGWEFLFIGANIDAVETASEFGIESNRAVNYCADSKGTQVLYQSLAAPISAMRANEEISDDWSMSISADFEERK